MRLEYGRHFLFIMENEIWITVKDFEKYEFSNTFKVRRIGSKRLKAIQTNDAGYFSVSLYKNNNNAKHILIHRLIAEHFIPNPENKPQVNHINGIKTDNRVENLEWCTQSENMLHAYRTGLQIPKKGEEKFNSKLTQKDVLEIRELVKRMSQQRIANIFDVNRTTIQSIVEGRTWKHI